MTNIKLYMKAILVPISKTLSVRPSVFLLPKIMFSKEKYHNLDNYTL